MGMMMEELHTLDEAYEFSAPCFFDFIIGESNNSVREAELWFETALSYGPSPFVSRIKTERSPKMECLSDFDQSSESAGLARNGSSPSKVIPQPTLMPAEIKQEKIVASEPQNDDDASANSVSVDMMTCEVEEKALCSQENERISTTLKVDTANDKDKIKSAVKEMEACTPKLATNSRKGGGSLPTDLKMQQTSKKTAGSVTNPSALKPKNLIQSLQSKSSKSSIVKRDTNVEKIGGTTSLAQENQAIKKQKLGEGKSRHILNVKPKTFLHKTKPGEMANSSRLCPSTAKTCKQDRKIYAREPAVSFISTAEMMKKFQSNTREILLPKKSNTLSHDDAALLMQRKPKLKLTRPKEPELETAQRARPAKVKSFAELEEELMAKISKFKARPANKKILEGPTLPSLPRSIPQVPEFQEFHLETMSRAEKNAEASTNTATESSHQNHQWRPCHSEPKTPFLQTSLRTRPLKAKSTFELEQEELEKVPKFKARPLNRKIFESKGDLGMFSNIKRNVTTPQEFHFATDERIPPSAVISDLFDKLCLNSEPRHNNHIPRKTMPNPFHLHTEDRGAEKERKFVQEVMQKQLEEERVRIPKACPYPYTTDYPVIPRKPEPKQHTKPEPFQLESLVRHQEEMQKEMAERQRMEKEEAQMRIFRARPIMKEDPIPIQDKVRIPLTRVEEFNLHVDHRAIERSEFDRKVKEKEFMYKRYREETESARMIEEENALKQLRRTMVPHARPVPKFDHPFFPHKSKKETTKAKSPNLLVLQRRERRSMIHTFVATSSPAAQMR